MTVKSRPPNQDAKSESMDQFDDPSHEAVTGSSEGNVTGASDSYSVSSSDSESCSSLDDVGTLSKLRIRSIFSIEDVPPENQALET